MTIPSATTRRRRATTLPGLNRIIKEIRGHAVSYGLDFFEVIFELVDYDELNEIAAFGGFPTRYPHWKFGMDYEQLSKGYTYGLSKIYELVINNDPCYAYLMKSNSLVDQKLVIAHVYGHSDFFKNNAWFSVTDRKMIDEMANHGNRIRRYMEQHGVEKVESFIDACLSIDNLIDPHSPYIRRRATRTPPEPGQEHVRPAPYRLKGKSYMDRFINPPEFLEEQRLEIERDIERQKNFPEEPERDILLFLIEHTPKRYLDPWQRDILSIVREEAYYFAPQRMTKIMNEGWACIASDTPVFTDAGLIPMAEVVAGGAGAVSDGETRREVYDRNIIRDHEVVKLRTRRGLRLTGSTNHRVMTPDGWRRLDELAVGDRVTVSGGAGVWPERHLTLDRALRPDERMRDFMREFSGWQVEESRVIDERVGKWLGWYFGVGDDVDRRAPAIAATLSTIVRADESMIKWRRGDAPRDQFAMCFTASDEVECEADVTLETLAEQCSALNVRKAPDAGLPAAILRSPESVVVSFLAAYLSAGASVRRDGLQLRVGTPTVGEQVQVLLLSWGILAESHETESGPCLRLLGASAQRFAEAIGLDGAAGRKLAGWIDRNAPLEREPMLDEVVSLERDRADVYDISVRETHRYAAAGLINHNSYWHSTMMTQNILRDDEVIDYADHHAATLASSPGVLNPYKIGIELFRDIEDRWNRGRFGKAFDECDDMAVKAAWDKQLGLGREKIFEVRRVYNDLTFIDAFLTEDFCEEHKLFTYEYNKHTQEYVITSRDFQRVKQKLLFQLGNFGNPYIYVVDGNYDNRGELYLQHRHEGMDLKQDYAKEVLKNLNRVWGRPVHLESVVDKRRKVLTYDGKKHGERGLA